MAEVAVERVETPTGAYEVLVGSGFLGDLGALLERNAPAHRYVVIADATVARLYGESVMGSLQAAGKRGDLLTFPAGESQKNRKTWAELSDRMFASGVGRDAAVIALGGGVTGDLAGFVAATYMRGLPVVQVPSTLLAMVDSSVGGKTGVDTPAGKNLIGAFLQPRVVLADTDLLRTLPQPELRAGLAEAIKAGAVADDRYFHWIEGALGEIFALDVDALAELVGVAVAIKARVVARDERESGPRKMLNFGHTVGHAVEALSGFELLHGESIAIGMVVESEIGERMGVTEPGTTRALAESLARAGLPTRVPPRFDAERIVAATRSDKKARAGRVEYSLIERIGRASAGSDERWAWGVEDEVVLDALRARSE